MSSLSGSLFTIRETLPIEHRTRTYGPPIISATAPRGEVEPAVKHLARAVELLPALNLTRARIDPDFDPIRDRPEFKGLVSDLPGDNQRTDSAKA